MTATLYFIGPKQWAVILKTKDIHVIPAKAGIQGANRGRYWIPAFAGMTGASNIVGPHQ